MRARRDNTSLGISEEEEINSDKIVRTMFMALISGIGLGLGFLIVKRLSKKR